jgi:hypothetical protein
MVSLIGARSFQDKSKLKMLFEPFGTVIACVVRHRIDTTTGANTSW